jgi:hypothetical protein
MGTLIQGTVLRKRARKSDESDQPEWLVPGRTVRFEPGEYTETADKARTLSAKTRRKSNAHDLDARSVAQFIEMTKGFSLGPEDFDCKFPICHGHARCTLSLHS